MPALFSCDRGIASVRCGRRQTPGSYAFRSYAPDQGFATRRWLRWRRTRTAFSRKYRGRTLPLRRRALPALQRDVPGYGQARVLTSFPDTTARRWSQ